MTVNLAFYIGTKAENPEAQIGDRLICWWTDSRFSHVEFIERQQDNGIAICWAASQRDGCVRQKAIDLSTGRWVTAELDADYDQVLAWFKAHAGEPYDRLGALSHVLPKPVRPMLHRAGHWYCSRAIAMGAGWADTDLDPGDISVRSDCRLLSPNKEPEA